MRKIKFRAWWKDRAGNAFELIEDLEDRYITDLNASHLIVEQYTGLKDRNGQEVYEGDVLKYWYESWGFTSVGPAVVEYHECNFCLRVPSDVHFNIWLGTKSLKDIVIIGNIHENPELLK